MSWRRSWLSDAKKKLQRCCWRITTGTDDQGRFGKEQKGVMTASSRARKDADGGAPRRRMTIV